MNRIIEFIDSLKEDVLYLQKNLVSIPALSPENGGDGEEKKADFLLNFLRKRGFPNIKVFSAKDERVSSKKRPNIVSLIEGKESSKTLWIVSHLDIVPPGDLELWDTDPYKLVVKGDLLYGRGVEDNHHGLVASLLCAHAYLKCKVLPKYNMGLIFVSDEETGSKYGLDFLLKEHRDIFSSDDEFLVPDFGAPDSTMIEVAEKCMLWLKVTVEGKQCHASTPHKGINSLVGAARLIVKVRDLYKEFAQKNKLFDPPISTFEPTKKEENVPNVNTIPGKDVFYIDCRILPEVEVDDVLKKLDEFKKKIEEDMKVKIKYEVIHKEPSSFTSLDCYLVKKLKEAIKTIYKKDAFPKGIGGGTVAAFPRRYGYPAVAWATLFETAHQPNEHTSIKNIINDAKVMSLLFV